MRGSRSTRRLKVGLAAGLLGLAASGASARLNMNPGLWEDAIAADDGSFHTERKCYLQRDVDNIDAFQRGAIKAPDGSCSSSDYSASGNTVTYRLSCKVDGETRSISVTAIYEGDKVTARMERDGVVTRLTRRRIGDCSKSSLGP